MNTVIRVHVSVKVTLDFGELMVTYNYDGYIVAHFCLVTVQTITWQVTLSTTPLSRLRRGSHFNRGKKQRGNVGETMEWEFRKTARSNGYHPRQGGEISTGRARNYACNRPTRRARIRNLSVNGSINQKSSVKRTCQPRTLGRDWPLERSILARLPRPSNSIIGRKERYTTGKIKIVAPWKTSSLRSHQTVASSNKNL